MLKLYGGPRTRGTLIQWYLEEIGVEYELISLDLQAGEHRQPEYLAINPMGKVPALVDGDYKLWESGAILMYLAEKYVDSSLDLPTRSTLYQWILFANATLGPGVVAEASRDRAMANLLPPLNQLFAQQPFVMGDRFTVADVAVGAMLAYLPMMFKVDFSAYPAILDYTKRLAERPAFQKTIGARS